VRDACAVVVLLCYAEERETVCVLCGLLSLCLCVRAGASGGGGRGGARGEVERWGWGRGGVCRTHLSCARQKGVRARPPRLSPLPCACAWVRKQPKHTHHGRHPLPALALGDAARAGRGQAGRRREQSGRARPGLGRLARLFVRLQVCGRGECVPLAAGERGGVGEYRALARRGKREADAARECARAHWPECWPERACRNAAVERAHSRGHTSLHRLGMRRRWPRPSSLGLECQAGAGVPGTRWARVRRGERVFSTGGPSPCQRPFLAAARARRGTHRLWAVFSLPHAPPPPSRPPRPGGQCTPIYI